MADYDIGEAFQRIEEEMIASMSRNLKRHLATEAEEGLNYAMWQAEQLAALNNFRKNNKKLFSGYFSTINGQISDVLWRANKTGQMDQEVAILEAIKKGFKVKRRGGGISGQFFRINERKMNALIKATQKDMIRAENAMLRKADDEYRKIIYNADVYYSSGAGTLPQCVDMATRDFLSRGINCIEYRNGAIVGIDAYARMALRTTQTRARLYGEATKRDEWGINTVYVTRRGAACPKCLQWIARVYYDDVWSSLPIPEPAQYPLLSEAISGGLYHPNCKDSHTTYFEGISEEPKPLSQKEIDEANRVYKLEQRQRYNERQIRRFKRLSDGSVDPENAARYAGKLNAWQTEQRRFVKANSDVLKRRYELEKFFPAPPSLTGKVAKVDNSGKSGIIGSERNISARNMASGNRRPVLHTLTEGEIKLLREDVDAIKADPRVFCFNSGDQTGYNDEFDIIQVRGDVLPDETSIHPRDLMSSRAVLAHEYYGHRANRGTKLKKGSWNDEFRASYLAAQNSPGLSYEDRRYLILDAIERAKEAGVTINHNKFMRRILYG